MFIKCIRIHGIFFYTRDLFQYTVRSSEIWLLAMQLLFESVLDIHFIKLRNKCNLVEYARCI